MGRLLWEADALPGWQQIPEALGELTSGNSQVITQCWDKMAEAYFVPLMWEKAAPVPVGEALIRGTNGEFLKYLSE